MRIGLIVNPVAGVGGPVALKGSDDRALVDAAIAAGAEARAAARATAALRVLGSDRVDLLCGPGEMGAASAAEAGIPATVIGAAGAVTTADDTRAVAGELLDAGIELLLFAGGDGTAVDILGAVGERVPVIGIPAGVKMHSAVFALTPRRAGELARAVVDGSARSPIAAEVMDIDEAVLREGSIAPRLHGYLRVPAEAQLIQAGKSRSGPRERAAQAGIAAIVEERVLPRGTCAIGPGTTAKAVLDRLGLPATLLGFDCVQDGRVVAADPDAESLLALADAGPLTVVVTPVGGQGFVIGRGNQQLAPALLRMIGPDAIVIVATEHKLAALRGRPLLVDTGDDDLDETLTGYRRVITGYGREMVYRVAR